MHSPSTDRSAERHLAGKPLCEPTNGSERVRRSCLLTIDKDDTFGTRHFTLLVSIQFWTCDENIKGRKAAPVGHEELFGHLSGITAPWH
jgi:hypothetical protein